MNKKQLYETPEAELFFVRFEENLLVSEFGDEGEAGKNASYNIYEEDF